MCGTTDSSFQSSNTLNITGVWSLIELTSLYTVPLSAVNGLSRLTTTSNGQARPIRKFPNRQMTFESNRISKLRRSLVLMEMLTVGWHWAFVVEPRVCLTVVCVLTGSLLAHRTNGRAYGTILCPSVCNACIVAKRYVLPKNCRKKHIGLPDRYPNSRMLMPIRTPYEPYSPKRGTDCTPNYLHCELRPNCCS